MVSVDQLMSALEKALEDVLGQDVEVSQDDEMEADLDADAEADMGALDMDMDAEEDDAEADEDEMDESHAQFMEQVYQKVLARLQEEK
jgi:hypothetical protein